MVDGEETVLLECPECGEEEQAVLRASVGSWVLKCATCGFTRTLPAPRQERMRPVPLILSRGATSESRELQVPVESPVAVGDEYDLDGHRVLLTAIERADGSRPPKVPGAQVRILYGKLFDTVSLSYTLNQGDVTRSFSEEVPPEEEIHVGSVREVQGVRLAVKTLKSDQNRTLHRGYLLARNVRRVFADVAPAGRPPGSKVRTRLRGKGVAPKARTKT